MLNEVIGSGVVPELGEQILEIPQSEVPESEISVEVTSEPLYCVCQQPWDVQNRRFMIHCDICSDWFHGECVGVTAGEAKEIEKYHCPKCSLSVGPSIYLSADSKAESKKKSLRCTPEFITKLKEYKFNIPDEVVKIMRGQAFTLPWLITKGFNRPIMIESVEALGMKLPPDTFTVKDVERYVGSERMVDVIDVERQTDVLMSMREFTEYFTSPSRTKLYNLISLEFTHTNLNKLVDAPYVSRKLDWVKNFWPRELRDTDDESLRRPAVSKYCLLSVKDSYTDFHIDFGGTSVWYHVLWGEKVFYLIEPSKTNLDIYYKWMKGDLGDDCFLADEVENCFRVVLKKGQTFFIPTGWIHAVYTPEDSLVFGGNFLHILNMDLQLQVYDIEKRLHTPGKYLFPSFEVTHWFAANSLIQELQTLHSTSFVPLHITNGLKALINALRIWYSEKEIGRNRREIIPAIINCKKTIHDLTRELKQFEKRYSGSHSHSPKDLSKREHIDANVPAKPLRSLENGHSHSNASSLLSSPIDDSSNQGRCNDSQSSVTYSTSQSSTSPLQAPVIKIKLKKSLNHNTSCETSPSSSPKEPRLKLRLSLSEGKAESVDCDSNNGSDALYIVESETDDKYEFRNEDSSEELYTDAKTKRKHHHKKCRKGKTGKLKHDKEHNKKINDELAGTLDGLEELFSSSKYSERISQCENTSQAIKDTVAGMSAMKDRILPSYKKSKHKKKKHRDGGSQEESDSSIEGIKKVHQDEDYIYLPLAGSDDESPVRKSAQKRGKRKEDDESWTPRAKVGPLIQRDKKDARRKAKREAVEKGLEKAAATLEEHIKTKKRRKTKHNDVEKVKKPKIVPSTTSILASTTSSSCLDIAAKSTLLAQKFASTPGPQKAPSRKPKKGMATAKQRLGKILKINKFARF